MSIPVTKDDIVAVHGLADVNRWAKDDDNNVTIAIAKGWSEIRSAALNQYTADSFDAMSSLPPIVLGYAVDLASDWLSSGNQRFDEIETRAVRARLWLARLATGFDHEFDAILTAKSEPSGGTSVRMPNLDSRFDTDDPMGQLRRRILGI